MAIKSKKQYIKDLIKHYMYVLSMDGGKADLKMATRMAIEDANDNYEEYKDMEKFKKQWQ